jgi:integrase/recombinase XerD
MLATLAYTTSQVWAVTKLRLGDFQHDGQYCVLPFQEKGGKGREIPVRHDLRRYTMAYVEADLRAGQVSAVRCRIAVAVAAVQLPKTAINDLHPLEDVQYLAGHAEPRTTGLYDRRQKKVTRNIVERISI